MLVTSCLVHNVDAMSRFCSDASDSELEQETDECYSLFKLLEAHSRKQASPVKFIQRSKPEPETSRVFKAETLINMWGNVPEKEQAQVQTIKNSTHAYLDRNQQYNSDSIHLNTNTISSWIKAILQKHGFKLSLADEGTELEHWVICLDASAASTDN